MDNWGLFLQFPKYSFELSLKGCLYKYPNIQLSDKIWKNTQKLSSIILHQIAKKVKYYKMVYSAFFKIHSSVFMLTELWYQLFNH